MNRFVVIIKLAIVCLCIFAATKVAAAGTGPESLDRFYDKVESFRARFDQVVLDEGLNLIEESSGEMWITRPGRFRWDYEPPLAQQIVSNGERVWVFDPDLEQVTIRRVDIALGETPAILLAGRGDLKQRYKLSDLGLQGSVSWVSLKPRNAEADFEDIRIGFENDRLRVIELVDGLGQMTRIVLNDGQENPDIQPGTYEFTVPEGADVIDEAPQ